MSGNAQVPNSLGSLDTPNLDGGGGGASALNTGRSTNNNSNTNTTAGTNQTANGDRFRFDAATTGNFMNEQRRFNMTACDAGLECHDTKICQRSLGSQSNLHHIPLTSCTSIGQNLSTSDQQPLIVDVQPEHCPHHHHLQQQLHTHQHSDHENPYNGNSNNLSRTTSQCCLKTTSFMANDNNNSYLHNKCTCCEQEFIKNTSEAINQPLHHYHHHHHNSFIGSNGFSADGIAIAAKSQLEGCLGAFWDDQKKSRTLTRVYKPLNDLHIPYASTNDLVENFYIPPSDIRLKKHL